MAIIPKEGEDALCHRFEGSEFESEHLVLREVFITGESHPFLYRQESIEIHIIIQKIYEGVIAPQLKLRDEFGSPVLFNVSVQGNHGRELLASLKRTTGIVEYRCSIPANWLSSGRYFLTVNFGKDVDPDQPLYNQRAFGLRNELCFHVRSREQEFISDPLHYSFNPELIWGHIVPNSWMNVFILYR
jgi:hypothetical protein